MSQYPPPYSSQQPGYGGYPPGNPPGNPPGYPPPSPEQLLAPARRAGVAMIALGVLAVFCGLCLAFMGSMLDSPELVNSPQYTQVRQQFQEAERQLGMPITRLFLVMGAVPLVIGAILGALGFGVRGGSRGVTIGAIVYVALLLALLALVMLGGLVQMLATGGRPDVILGMCVYGIPFVMLVLVMVWLVQSVRASAAIESARRNYQAQLWQYQQYQQAYLQQGTPPGGPTGPPPSPQQPPPTGMGYHFPQPPQGSAPPQPYIPPQQPGAPPPAPPAEPPAERKEPPDGAPPAG